jgi:hypothetical protein
MDSLQLWPMLVCPKSNRRGGSGSVHQATQPLAASTSVLLLGDCTRQQHSASESAALHRALHRALACTPVLLGSLLLLLMTGCF